MTDQKIDPLRWSVAAKLTEARTEMKAALGDQYDAKMEPWRKVVRACVAESGLTPIEVGHELSKDPCLTKVQSVIALVAAVDVALEAGQ